MTVTFNPWRRNRARNPQGLDAAKFLSPMLRERTLALTSLFIELLSSFFCAPNVPGRNMLLPWHDLGYGLVQVVVPFGHSGCDRAHRPGARIQAILILRAGSQCLRMPSITRSLSVIVLGPLASEMLWYAT